MKIIVTGGAGFIASHITDNYIKAGHRVVVIDNLSTGSKKNLNPKAKFYRVDIKDLNALRAIFKKEKPDIVNHHAAIAEVVKSVRDPLPTLNTNVTGTINLLITGGEVGIKKFIFASTGGAIYGNPKHIPANEMTPSLPLSPYGLSKQLGEEAIKYYARQYKFDYLIFRYANVYGPRQNPNGEAGIVAIFSKLMRGGVRPKIFGDGTKTRDYVYVGDVAHASLIALSKGKGTELNIGCGRQITDQAIFDGISVALDFSKPPIYKPFRKGEVLRTALDAKKAGRVIGWKPKVMLAEGIKKAVTNS